MSECVLVVVCWSCMCVVGVCVCRAHKSRDLRDLDRGHKDTPGDTFWMTWIYFLVRDEKIHADMQKTNSAACVIFLDAVSICLLSWDLSFAANTYTIRCVVHKIGLSLNF